jgi:hypothetical protein
MSVELKSGLEGGVWFEQNLNNVFGYHGTRPVVIESERLGTTVFDVSRCPQCERGRIQTLGKTIKRWMILPP